MRPIDATNVNGMTGFHRTPILVQAGEWPVLGSV